MTRIDLPDDVDFEFVSDAELSALIHEIQIMPELELTDDMIIGDEDLALHIGPSDPIDALFADAGDPLFDYTEEEWITELDLAFDNAFTPTNRFERGVGYCENVECNDYLKGTFLMLHEGPTFTCSACSTKSTHILAERGIVDRDGSVPFACIKVEYSYCPVQKRYLEMAIVRDDSYSGPSGTYTVQNPLCRTPMRATKIAEAMLNVINEGVILDEDLSNTPRSHERILSFDKPMAEFRIDLEALEHRLMDNSFLRSTSVFPTTIEVELNLEEGDSSGPESNDLGGTTDPEPRLSSGRDGGAGPLHFHPGDQSSGVRPGRAESRLHPLQPMGTRSKSIRRGPSEGRRSGHHRTVASKLRAAAGRIFPNALRSKSRRGPSGT
jgi:hypothetical protein